MEFQADYSSVEESIRKPAAQRASFTSELFRFAFFPDFNGCIHYLSEHLAEKEVWDFAHSPNRNHGILKNYLEHTFRRLQQEGKLLYSEDQQYACFNTGLVTDSMEYIVAFFEQYNNPKPGLSSPFFFKSFIRLSDRLIHRYFGGFTPEPANYFERPDLLLFNPLCEVVPDPDHMAEAYINRFPPSIQQVELPELRRILYGAIEESRKRARANFHLAVPQYYDGKVQLLLPMSFTAGSNRPDVALVMHRLNDTTYSARTVLTLNMAYNNARLIARPAVQWLQP